VVPPERHRELRLVATAIAIAEREAIAGDGPALDILERLVEFYGNLESGARASRPHGSGRDARGPDDSLLHRLAVDLRRGAFERCDRSGRAARAILWRLTIWKLREGNPQFLAENGFGE